MRDRLIIGIGNTLCGDDGVAAAVLAHLGRTVAVEDVLVVHQLTIEMAPLVAECHSVLFIDAALKLPEGTFSIQPLSYGTEVSSPFGHQLTPAELIQLSSALFGEHPKAYMMAIGAGQFDDVDCLSPKILASLPIYTNVVELWYREHKWLGENTTSQIEIEQYNTYAT